MLLLNHQQLRRACVAPANVASKTTIFQHLLTFLRPRFLRIGTRLPTTRPRRDRDEALCAVSKVKQQFCVIMGGTSKENLQHPTGYFCMTPRQKPSSPRPRAGWCAQKRAIGCCEFPSGAQAMPAASLFPNRFAKPMAHMFFNPLCQNRLLL